MHGRTWPADANTRGCGDKEKSQIADTKNPGLSTRVFAIDSKQTLAYQQLSS